MTPSQLLQLVEVGYRVFVRGKQDTILILGVAKKL